MAHLTVSIVLHRSPPALLARTLASLRCAALRARQAGLMAGMTVFVVDNASGADYRARVEALLRGHQDLDCRLLARAVHDGYGGGHNAVGSGGGEFRLVLNPDVILAPDALLHALEFLRCHPPVKMVVPRGWDGNGRPAWLCKDYPSVAVLGLRGFAPSWLRRRFAARLAAYEMRDRDWSRPVFDPGLASGCCLLLRGELWQATGGFDAGYFLYFEDFDFTLRARRFARVAYLPGFSITHLGGGAAAKGRRHVLWFVRSGWRFFRRHGWRWW